MLPQMRIPIESEFESGGPMGWGVLARGEVLAADRWSFATGRFVEAGECAAKLG